MPRALRILVLLFLLGPLGQVGTVAQQAPLRVGVYSNAPKVFMDEDGKASGILIDLLREVASAEQLSLEFVACEWRSCMDALAAGRIDLLPATCGDRMPRRASSSSTQSAYPATPGRN